MLRSSNTKELCESLRFGISDVRDKYKGNIHTAMVFMAVVPTVIRLIPSAKILHEAPDWGSWWSFSNSSISDQSHTSTGPVLMECFSTLPENSKHFIHTASFTRALVSMLKCFLCKIHTPISASETWGQNILKDIWHQGNIISPGCGTGRVTRDFSKTCPD